jgi:hypothetical protein
MKVQHSMAKGAWEDLHDIMRGGEFNVTLRIYPIRKDQHKWVIAIELSRIRSRWRWLSTPLLKIKMHWWGDDYVMVQSWCKWYVAMRHVAMQCSQSYGTNLLNPWVMPSNFSELSKDMRYWKKRISKCLAQNGKPPWFRLREENVAEFNGDNPTTYNENVNRKARLTIVMLSSKGWKIHQKGQLCYEIDQWPTRCKVAS